MDNIEEDGSVLVNLEEKAPEKKEDDLEVVEKKPEPVVTKKEEPEDEAIVSLKKQIEESRQREQLAETKRIEAERAAAEEKNKTLDFQNKAQQNQYDSIVNALGNSNAVLKSAKIAYAKALADGDYVVAADEQEKIARATANITQLEAGKDRMEQLLEVAKNQPRAEAPTDPFEQLVSTRTPRTAAWMRANADHVKDPKKFLRLQAADNLARANDHAPDSDAYFDFIEKEVGIKPRETITEKKEPSKPMDAPVTRTAPNGQSQHSNKTSIKLSKAEVEMAESMGLTVQEYARSKAQLISEGQINN